MSAILEDALYGGKRIETEDGFVEISIFETGKPPQFRLYFFDREKRPVAPPSALTVTLETTRSQEAEAKQVFSFAQEGSYLRSTSDIPEPHDFEVLLTLIQKGKEKVYETAFAEDAHGHSHDKNAHDYSHEAHGHSHGHGTGLLGWFQSTFANSHAAADKIDDTMESNTRGIAAIKISLIGLLATAFLQLVVVLFSGSVALLVHKINRY